jgi:hypothetical protein
MEVQNIQGEQAQASTEYDASMMCMYKFIMSDTTSMYSDSEFTKYVYNWSTQNSNRFCIMVSHLQGSCCVLFSPN